MSKVEKVQNLDKTSWYILPQKKRAKFKHDFTLLMIFLCIF